MKGPLKIKHLDGAKESLRECAANIPRDAKKVIAGMRRLLERLERGIQLQSPEQFRKEERLPNGSHFYAVKTKNGLRCYGWYSKRSKGTFVVSHYTYKKKGGLSQSDTDLVTRNFRRYENGE